MVKYWTNIRRSNIHEMFCYSNGFILSKYCKRLINEGLADGSGDNKDFVIDYVKKIKKIFLF